ncbi:MAG: SoxR reducing system RseC family protein [Spirochaetaceae bacterium]|jgi:positive regulator of sigma E activity|nr:SoxR reducing system RseC family protein [Spirochaetaceae bacterium]
MRETGMVVRIEPEGVWVKAVEIEACINCDNSGCSKKQGNAFFCLNPNELPLSEGTRVRVAAPIRNQLFEGLSAILFPLAAAVTGYILASIVLPLIGAFSGDGWNVGTALLFLLLSAMLVYLRSSSRPGGTPVITEVL